MFGLKSGAFKKWLCISFIVCFLVFLALGSVLWRRSPVKPEKVSAAEIIQKQLEVILEKGTIYHHKVIYYSDLAPDKPEPQPTIYEIWDDQDSDRFKNVVIYPDGGGKVIQAFNGDTRWDYDEEEKTLRKDIYIYPDSSERETQHGDRLDLVKTYRELLENGVLDAHEGELEGKKVWIVVDERELTSSTFWNRFYFEKESFTLLRQERWQKKNGKEVLTDRMDYEIIESIPKKGLDVNEFFHFDYSLPEDTVILERHFNFSSGYVEDDYYPATPSAFLATPTPDLIADWKVYQNKEYEFEIKYPPDYFVSTTTNGVMFAHNKWEGQLSTHPYISIEVFETEYSVDEWVKGEIEEKRKEGFGVYGDESCQMHCISATAEEIRIGNNIQALQYKWWGVSGGGDYIVAKKGETSNWLVVIYSHIAGARDPGEESVPGDILDEMLSTFKFSE